MNTDQLKGKLVQVKGSFKQQFGKFSDDALLQIEGIDDTNFGRVQERYGDKNDELMKWEKQWQKASAAETTTQKTR